MWLHAEGYTTSDGQCIYYYETVNILVPLVIVLLIARLKKGLWPFDRASDDDLDWDLGFYTSYYDRERRDEH